MFRHAKLTRRMCLFPRAVHPREWETHILSDSGCHRSICQAEINDNKDHFSELIFRDI